MVLPSLLPLLFLTCLEAHYQTPYLTFLGKSLMNHSYVDFSLVGNLTNGSDSVQCHTHLPDCCSRLEGRLRGDWLSLYGVKLPFHSDSGIHQNRRAQRVDLRRFNVTSPTGIYCCRIPYDPDDPSLKAMLYVGLYFDGGNNMSVFVSSTVYQPQCLSTYDDLIFCSMLCWLPRKCKTTEQCIHESGL